MADPRLAPPRPFANSCKTLAERPRARGFLGLRGVVASGLQEL